MGMTKCIVKKINYYSEYIYMGIFFTQFFLTFTTLLADSADDKR